MCAAELKLLISTCVVGLLLVLLRLLLLLLALLLALLLLLPLLVLLLLPSLHDRIWKERIVAREERIAR